MQSSALKDSTATGIEQVLNVQSVRGLPKGTFLKRQSTENRASQPECHGVLHLCHICSAIQGRSYLANCVLQSRGQVSPEVAAASVLRSRRCMERLLASENGQGGFPEGVQ